MAEAKTTYEDFDLDPNDEGLKAVMGGKFRDMSQNKEPQKMANSAAERLTGKPAKVKEEKPADASWEPADPEPDWMDKLKACTKWVILFGGLNMLLFYWQQAGLMAESIAVPSMCVCAALAGWGVGRNAARQGR